MDETLTLPGGDRGRGDAIGAWGPFSLIEKLGEGSYGEVFRAFDTVLEREVALKLLRPRHDRPGDERATVLREARLLAKVRHPNVVSVYGVDTYGGRVGFWSDLVKGRTLEAALQVQGAFSPREAALTGIDLCQALSAVHAAGLLHRDIKAGNAMREEGGRILLMDFGLCLDRDDTAPLGGTLPYMSPELFDGAAASVESDIYALGVLLFHLLTGRYPIEASSVQTFAEEHRTERRGSIFQHRADLPDRFASVIEKSLDRDPARRYRSAGEMLIALSESIQSDARPVKSRRGRHWATIALLVTAGAGAAIWWSRPTRGAYASYLEAQDLLEHYYRPHNIERALQAFQRTAQLDSRFAPAAAGMCRTNFLRYRDTDDRQYLDAARESCSKALALNQNLASVHVTLGMMETLSGKHDLATQELEEAVRLDSRNAEAYGAMAELYNRQGRSKDTESAFQKAADLAPQDWRWPNQLGYYYMTNGRLDEAVKQYRSATALTPDNSRAWNNLGMAYRRQSRFGEAKSAFYKAIDLAPADNYFSNLGLVLMQEGSYQEAADLYQKALKLNENNYLTWANLGSVYDRLPGNEAKAKEAYRKAIVLAEDLRQRSPRDAMLLGRLGSYYATLGMRDESLPLVRQATALAPDDPNILFHAAEAHELLHERDEAIEWIGKALARQYSVEALRRDPEMAALIRDKRFERLVAKKQGK